MPSNRDWLPHSRIDQLNMAKVWDSGISSYKDTWKIPAEVRPKLQGLTTEAEGIYHLLTSPDRSTTTTAEANRIFGELITYMRFLKDRYFKQPPLLPEHFVMLLLNIPDTTRTTRGDPRAQMTAEIKRSGTDMLILAYKYAEGTEHLADSHTDISKQLRWGLLPPPGITPSGNDLTKVPVDPLELPNVIDTHRKTDIINFPIGSSGKTAYFVIRLHNGKSGYGPYCPIFSAIVP